VTGGRASLTDTLVSGPNLFVPIGPDVDFLGTDGRERVGRMRDRLSQMTFSEGPWEWGERAKVLDAVVRALLREDILLRLPRSVFKDADETWAAGILPAAERDAESSWLDSDDLGNASGTDYVPLPDELLEHLRANLAVDPTATE
jgi:hypothetical protein